MKISRRKRHGLVQHVDQYLLYMFNDFCCSADGHGKEVDSPLSLCMTLERFVIFPTSQG